MSMIILLFLPAELFDPLQAQMNYTDNGDSEIYSHSMNNATAIYTELFTKRTYNKALSPVFDGPPFNTSIAQIKISALLTYMLLFNLDAEKQICSAIVDMDMSWRDPRLAWNKLHFGAVESIYVNLDVLWIPDTRISDVKTLDTLNGILARVTSNGTVYTATNYFVELSCQLEVDTFPFDTQQCTINIFSMILGKRHISLNFSIDNDRRLYGNGEWKIIDATAIHSDPFGDGAFLITIKRVPNFYIYVIALPCFILTLLSIVGMFWTANTREEQLAKLGIGLTTLVSMTVLLDMLSREIPKTQVFPLLGIFVIYCLGVISCACVAIVAFPIKKVDKKESGKHHKVNGLKNMLLFEKWPKFHNALVIMKNSIWHRHFLFQLTFQVLNLVGFIVFLSFWRD